MKDNDLSAILKDVERAKERTEIYVTDKGIVEIPRAGFSIGGTFTFEHKRHEDVHRARDDGDSEKEAWMRDHVRSIGDTHYKRNYMTVDQDRAPNLIPNVGLDFVLDVLMYASTLKINTWNMGPFTSDWTPAATADADWAGAGSGPLATELQQTEFDETNRQGATFASAASSQLIATSTPTTFTLATGVSNLALYGVTMNEINTINYNATDKILLAATRFASAKTGLDAGDLANIGYELGAANS
jgi:hypothetical protein